MEGWIYIAGSFTEIGCGCRMPGQLCNDPHFWTEPPTWGICRTDYRRVIQPDNYVFFVLPKYGCVPQMVFAYLKVLEKITHLAAFQRRDILSKRMGNKNPNGNIIVDEHGKYNRFDAGTHRSKFEEIKEYYVLGVQQESRMLTKPEMRRKAPSFVTALSQVFDQSGSSPYEIIFRKGRRMDEDQVRNLLRWLNE